MYELIFRKGIFPALDFLNDTQVAGVIRYLEQAESRTLEALLDYQRAKLEEALSWTRKQSRFYEEFWQDAPDERRAASDYSALDGMPIVTKEDLRSNLTEFPLEGYRGRVLRVNTSGSTGAPMTFFRTREQESWFWALRFRMWNWAGYQMGEPYVAINLNQRTGWRKRVQDVFFRCTYMTYHADNQDSALIVEEIREKGIRHINAFGSTLLVLAEFMRDNEVENPGVRVLTSTGDNLFREQRETIESAFGVGVHDYYGAGGEGVHLASQCQERSGYHIHLENNVIEVIKDGRPARTGEVGNIVVTQLDNRAMPLIRYDMGDLATVGSGDPCPCGRAHPVLESINGRACDVVHTPEGGALLPQFFFIGPFKTMERVHRYQIIQDQLEEITIKLVAELGCERKQCEESLRSEIDRASNGSLGVRFEWVDEIPLAGLGKPRPVISNLKTGEPLERAVQSVEILDTEE